MTSNRRWKVIAASVPQGHRTAGWEAAGDEPHAPRGPAGALQRPPGRTEAHGAQLVGAPDPASPSTCSYGSAFMSAGF